MPEQSYLLIKLQLLVVFPEPGMIYIQFMVLWLYLKKNQDVIALVKKYKPCIMFRVNATNINLEAWGCIPIHTGQLLPHLTFGLSVGLRLATMGSKIVALCPELLRLFFCSSD